MSKSCDRRQATKAPIGLWACRLPPSWAKHSTCCCSSTPRTSSEGSKNWNSTPTSSLFGGDSAGLWSSCIRRGESVGIGRRPTSATPERRVEGSISAHFSPCKNLSARSVAGLTRSLPYTSLNDRAFFRSRLPRLVSYYLLLDLLQHSRSTTLLHSASSAANPFDLAKIAWAWSHAITFYLQLWISLTIPALLLVSTGFSPPSAYPYVMGSASHMSSLRGVWGRTWHQFGRPVVTSITLRLRNDDLLRVPAGSSASACIWLCTGFALGAGTHWAAGWMAGSRSGWRDESGAATFFALQFLGIVLEDGLLLDLFSLRAPRSRRRTRGVGCRSSSQGAHGGIRILGIAVPPILAHFVGYIWVFCWLSLTLPPYVDGLGKVGALREVSVPVSVLGWAVVS